MTNLFIGREKEQAILEKALQSREAEMISVIGRRRVGKTFLIKTVYEHRIVFKVTGIQNASRDMQLRNFMSQLAEAAKAKVIGNPPKDWLDAFLLLIQFLKTKKSTEKTVIFLDELPWLATRNSGFLQGLSYFWNSWAVDQNIVVVVCGSAASWMIDNILRHKGGLHNRVTKRIRLEPFNLAETKRYLQSRNIYMSHYHLIQLYMAMGGVPHYLKEIEGGKSAIQNIDQICFSKTGLLYDEFLSLYVALFKNADYHTAIIRALASKWKGMSRKEIIKTAKLVDSGKITRILKELIESGFISDYYPFGKKKKDKLYRLTDYYSLFYLQFIENNVHQGEGTWQMLSQTQTYKIWSGYAFENICLQHIPQIKKALGISGIYTLAASFLKKGTADESGTQIDLIIDRNDHVINLFEIKFYNTEFVMTKEYAKKMRNKMGVFQEATKTKKQIFISFISTFGLKQNMHSLGLITDSFDMDILFEI